MGKVVTNCVQIQFPEPTAVLPYMAKWTGQKQRLTPGAQGHQVPAPSPQQDRLILPSCPFFLLPLCIQGPTACAKHFPLGAQFPFQEIEKGWSEAQVGRTSEDASIFTSP